VGVWVLWRGRCSFYRPEKGKRECDLGRRSNSLPGKEGAREVTEGRLGLWGTGEYPRRVRISGAQGFRGEPEGRATTALPRFSDHVRARGGKGEERGGQVGATQGF
jgi:hypothetical protein